MSLPHQSVEQLEKNLDTAQARIRELEQQLEQVQHKREDHIPEEIDSHDVETNTVRDICESIGVGFFRYDTRTESLFWSHDMYALHGRGSRS